MLTQKTEIESAQFSIERGVCFVSVRRRVGVWDAEKEKWVGSTEIVGEVYNEQQVGDSARIEDLVGESMKSMMAAVRDANDREQAAKVARDAAIVDRKVAERAQADAEEKAKRFEAASLDMAQRADRLEAERIHLVAQLEAAMKSRVKPLEPEASDGA